MHCPFCNAADSKVIDSRLAAEGCQIRRRRECVVCGERFTTFESYEVVMPRVIKSDGKSEPFDEEKLRRSLMHALQKRPVTQEQIETVLSDIQSQIRRLGERDVNSVRLSCRHCLRWIMSPMSVLPLFTKIFRMLRHFAVRLSKCSNVKMKAELEKSCRN